MNELHRPVWFRLVAVILLAGGLVPLPVAAQPSHPQATVDALSRASGHLLGDWGGLRSTLQNDGIDLGLSYLGEAAWNAAGGKRPGVDYAGQEKVKLDLDLGRIAGLHGASLHVSLVNRNGRNASADYVGDDLLQAQEIYGSGGDVLVHLADLYLEQSLRNGTVDLKAGRLPMETDFGTLPDACDFMALAICADWGIDHNLGWTSFPTATWGGSVTVQAMQHLSVAIGAFEVSARDGEPSGLYWSLGDAVGAILPVELDWKTRLANRRPGVFKIGAYFDSAHISDWYTAENGLALPLTASPARRSQRVGFYVLAQQMVWRSGPQPGEGLTLLAGYVHNSPDNSLLEHVAFFGLLDKGLFPGRPDDRAGLSFVHLRVSSNLTTVQELQASMGAPLSRGAPGVETAESLLEANYHFELGHGIGIMPDLQWVVHPSAATHYANALVLGLQVSATF